MATHKMIPSVKATPRDTVLKALEDRMKKSSEAGLRSLREACVRELRQLDDAAPKKAARVQDLGMPPNLEFYVPSEAAARQLLPSAVPLTVTRPVSASASNACETVFFFPPYAGCIPNTRQVVSGAPGTQVLIYEDCFWGIVHLEAATFSGDAGTFGDNNMTERTATALLIIGQQTLHPPVGTSNLTVTAPFQMRGSTWFVQRGGAPPTGAALIRTNVRLTVALLDANGNFTDIVENTVVPQCRTASPPPFSSYDLSLQDLDFTTQVSVGAPVISTGNPIGVAIGMHFELTAGVSRGSSLFAIGNFSPLRRLLQGPGLFSVPDVRVDLC